MVITLTNNSQEIISIKDLALELRPGESVLLSSYTDKQLLESSDLQAVMTSNPNVLVTMAGTSVNHTSLTSGLTNMTMANHESANTLKHNVSENYYFETTKENDQTKFITYYTDSLKINKIREEEIVRTEVGTVSQIIIKNFNDEGNLESTEIQVLNRNVFGKVENISVTTS